MHNAISHDSGFLHPIQTGELASYDAFLRSHPELVELAGARRREIRIGPGEQRFFTNDAPGVQFVVIAEPASVNTAIVLPILARIAEMMVRGSLAVVTQESAPALLRQVEPSREQALPLPSRELPLLLVLDLQGRLLAEWGPHPKAASAYIESWLDAHNAQASCADEDGYLRLDGSCPGQAQGLLHEMRIWYNSELTAACVAEVREILAAAQANEDGANVGGDVSDDDEFDDDADNDDDYEDGEEDDDDEEDDDEDDDEEDDDEEDDDEEDDDYDDDDYEDGEDDDER